jgi:hypothetical protein
MKRSAIKRMIVLVLSLQIKIEIYGTGTPDNNKC